MDINDRRNIDLPNIDSREYKIFQEEERLRRKPSTLYEKACHKAEKILTVRPNPKQKKTLQDVISFSDLKITPEGAVSLTSLVLIATILPIFLILIFNLLGFISLSLDIIAVYLSIGLPFTYYIYKYPYRYKKIYQINVGSQIVTMIIYMSMYMRNTPNLERAVKFTSENLSGELVYELRKMLWDVEIRNYVTIQEALFNFTSKWKENKSLVESIELLINSTGQLGEKRIKTLDRAVDVVLSGNRENARHFTQDLKTPVMVVHAMGVVLPLLGFVLFPLVSTFLGIGSAPLFILYNILLPIILYFVITNILETRPVTYSLIEIADNPDLPKEGKFKYNKLTLGALPISIAVSIGILFIGYIVNLLNPVPDPNSIFSIASALLVTASIGFGISTYYFLTSFQYTKVRDNVMQIESEFSNILFQIGNNMSNGIPIEKSMEKAVKETENLKVKGFFEKALNNMKRLGMTFKQAFFDKEYGAINYYPSKMIKSVMTSVVESSVRGASAASVTMLSVSKYVKSLHITQEEVRNELSDPVNSMKFQSYFISPMISAIVITLTVLIIRILSSISSQLDALPFVPILSILQSVGLTSFEFSIVVGIYLVETFLILSMFVNGIENGQDKIGFKTLVSKSVFYGHIFFWITLFITMAIFLPFTDITTLVFR